MVPHGFLSFIPEYKEIFSSLISARIKGSLEPQDVAMGKIY